MIQQISHKTRKDLISTQDWYKFFSTLLTEYTIEFTEEEEWKTESTNLNNFRHISG
jgi:hypothetical protein